MNCCLLDLSFFSLCLWVVILRLAFIPKNLFYVG